MSRDIVSFGFVRDVKVERGRASVRLRMQTQNQGAAAGVRSRVESAVRRVEGVASVDVQAEITRPPTPEETAARAIARDPRLIPEVKRVIAVASGKGGRRQVDRGGEPRGGARSPRLLDRVCSTPTSTGRRSRSCSAIRARGRDRLRPATSSCRSRSTASRLMSLGSILDADTPVIWRGPMVMKAIEQFLSDVEWGALDFLVIDLPPGTGDAQLTLTQKVPLSGAVIVTTPQDVALIDARKGLAMFRKVNVPVLGIVENMASFVCPHCGEETHIFRHGGGERTARRAGLPFLGSIPLDAAIAEGGDAGVPIVVAIPRAARGGVPRRSPRRSRARRRWSRRGW